MKETIIFLGLTLIIAFGIAEFAGKNMMTIKKEHWERITEENNELRMQMIGHKEMNLFNDFAVQYADSLHHELLGERLGERLTAEAIEAFARKQYKQEYPKAKHTYMLGIKFEEE